MKKFKRFFASFLCVCMIITSCPDILAWAAGDTAVVKTTKFEFSAKKLSKMVQKADKDNTDDNGLCKLSVPKAMNYGKQLKLRAYLQTDEENIVFLFVNKTKKRHAAAIIVDDMMSNIIAVSTKKELLDEEYATDSDSDYDYDVYTDGLLDADFMDMAAQVLDGTSNPSDNDADKEYDHLDGEAFDVVLRDGTVGAALVVSLEALGLDDMGELLPDDEDDEERSVVIASDSNAGSAVVLPGKDTAVVVPGADTPVVLPDQDQRPVVVDLPVATPSNSNVTVATPSNVAKTFIQELNGVKIKAHAEAGVIPDEATFEVIELKETGDTADAYKEACATLDADEETEYDGVMAYDLHFLLDGEEIQPDGEVQITMEVSERVLPENIDPESLEVKHLDETSGTVEVVTVADTGDKAEGTIAVNESVMAASEESDVAEQKTTNLKETAVMAEFNVNSFSYFVITYAVEDGKNLAELKVTLVDETLNALNLATADKNGQLIGWGDNGKQDPANLNSGYIGGSRINKWVSIKETAATFGEKTTGYTYLAAYKDQKCTNEIKWVYCKYTTYNYRGETYPSADNGWYYSTADSQPAKSDLDTSKKIGGSLNAEIFLKYKKNADIDTPIEDKIATDGSLTFAYDVKTDIPTEFIWQYSTDGTTWKDVEGIDKPVTGDLFKVVSDEKGTRLYPALDLKESEPDNIRKWYRVKVIENHVALLETNPIQVPYYKALQNGSFEEPKIEKLNQDGNFNVPNGTTGLEWRTTGEDDQIELVRTDVYQTDRWGNQTLVNWHGVTSAAAGKQYAELNAERAGALYQWVLTMPGSTLNWELYHHARTYRPDTGENISGTDTMYLVIAPTKKVEDCLNPEHLADKAYNYDQDRLEKKIVNVLLANKDADGYYNGNDTNYKGFYIQTISSHTDQDWQQNVGKYVVPEGDYLTSFFFVAGPTASNNETIGNLLDKVSFTTKLLPPSEGKTHIVVNKTVTGLQEEDLNNYIVTITLERVSNASVNDWKKVGEQNLRFSSTGYATAEFKDLDVNGCQYRVKETAKFIGADGKEYVPDYVGPDSKVNNNGTEETYTMGRYVDVTVVSGQQETVSFTNAYTPKYVSLTVEKKVAGNMGNTSQPFTFEIAVNEKKINIDGKYTGKTEGTTVKIENNQFQLKDGEEINIDKIPYGATVTIKETDANGYSTTYILDNGEETSAVEMPATGYTFSSDDMKTGHRIKFINTRNVMIPTGLFDNGHPTGWLYLMAAAAGCFAFGFYRRRKKKLNNGEECL